MTTAGNYFAQVKLILGILNEKPFLSRFNKIWYTFHPENLGLSLKSRTAVRADSLRLNICLQRDSDGGSKRANLILQRWGKLHSAQTSEQNEFVTVIFYCNKTACCSWKKKKKYLYQEIFFFFFEIKVEKMLNRSPISDRIGYKLALKSKGQESLGKIHCFKTADGCPNDKSTPNVKSEQHQMRSYVFFR